MENYNFIGKENETNENEIHKCETELFEFMNERMNVL